MSDRKTLSEEDTENARLANYNRIRQELGCPLDTPHVPTILFTVRFPNTNEAQNFHASLGYVLGKDPAERHKIGNSHDGPTVIVLALAARWSVEKMQRAAAVCGGRVVRVRDPDGTIHGDE
jgi:hypothetical protein